MKIETEILVDNRLSKKELSVLTAYAKGKMNSVNAAEKLGRSDTYVRNHLKKISERTGINPTNFFGLCALLGIRSVGNKDVCFVFFDGGIERIDLNKREVQFGDSEVFRWKKKG